jgi:dihydrodipicolinate synthase/N-acetylneuraminate lyase
MNPYSHSTSPPQSCEGQNGLKHHGVVVPMVTPILPDGDLDEPAVDRLIEFLLKGAVDGIFVLGTTGEGESVPKSIRRRLVARTIDRVQHRTKVYAGLVEPESEEAAAGNEYFHAGADAVVARPPVSFPVARLLPWFRDLLIRLEGPLILYNMPSTTNVSIPLDVVAELLGHPNLAGIKDSENNSTRLDELLRRFGNRQDFSIFVGVGALMERGLKSGAEGIVPSVGNLIPDVCGKLYACMRERNWSEAEPHAARMSAVSALYQKGRSVGQSVAALKAALTCQNLCGPDVLPPLHTLPSDEIDTLRNGLTRLGLLS